MKNKIFRIFTGCLMLFLLIFFSFSCKKKSLEQAGMEFGEPQYGGTITLRTASLNPDFDVDAVLMEFNNYWYESLWNMNWAIDRKEWSFKTNFLPEKYLKGLLAESWEIPDAQTIVVKLRKGVKWHNKAPVNGREFKASDVVKHYKRGWNNPIYNAIGNINEWESVTSSDDYTVQFKFKKPSGLWLLKISDTFPMNQFEAPEVAEKGLSKDWKYAIGTGPWILEDFVGGTSMTFRKNPDYYGHDERFPDNRVPYADTLKVLGIPDTPTAIAALRTGKIDILGAATAFGEPSLSWRESLTLKKSNPKLQQGEIPSPGAAIDLRCDRKPFSDINVRKALQISIDRKTIAKNYYGGTIDGNPCGFVNPVLNGYAFDYQFWPKKLKDEYSYDPEKAKQILKDAGYPNGFKTNIVASNRQDMQLLQVLQSQLKEIGVDMKINQMEASVFENYASSGKHDAMVFNSCGFDTYPTLINHRWSKNSRSNYTYNNDPGYDKIHEEFSTTTDPEKAAELMVEADRYAIEKHWSIDLFPTATYVAWQPYLKGYSGEFRLNFGGGYILSRIWVDQEEKASMGR